MAKNYCPEVTVEDEWGTANAKDRSVGTALEINCNPGYALVVDAAVCSANREWLPLEGKKCESFSKVLIK